MESRLGRYTVLKHLASGGMADVLLARSDGIEGFQRHVVLKRIRPEFSRDPRFVRMFLDEARLAANLHHQNIVHVHDVGEDGGEYFLAMEYIHGEDVRTLLSAASRGRQHIPLQHVLAIVSDAAAGLHYAHERRGSDGKPLGIVHRDVSPSNLLVGYDGSVKVVDFGIAKASAQEDTRSGNLRGKVSYMSPEQCKGERVDRRSDVYALGVMLYELATTTRLFKGDSDYKVMEAIVNGRVPSPRTKRPDLPEELSAIILRAIAVDPERRYFTAEELRVAIDQLARKLGLTSSNAAIASYMRKQFGDQPEPWVDLNSGGEFDSFEAKEPEPASPQSWSELPRSEAPSSSISIPRQTGPLPAAISSEAPPPPVRPTTTESWPAPAPEPAARKSPVAKALMIGAPLLAAAGVALWLLSGGSDKPAPVAAAPIPRPAPAAAPVAAVAKPVAPSVAEHMPAIDLSEPAKEDPRGHARTVTPQRRAVPVKVDEAPAIAAAVPAPVAPPVAKAAPVPAAGSAHPAPPPAPIAILPATPVAAPTPAAPPPPAPAVAAAVPAPAPVAVKAPPPAPAVAAPVAAPVTVASLDANRIAGDKIIQPDDSTTIEIKRRGMDRVIGVFKVCLTAGGDIASVSDMKSTGFPAYDWKISTTIRNRWRYKPYMVNGAATPVCTAVRLIYNQ